MVSLITYCCRGNSVIFYYCYRGNPVSFLPSPWYYRGFSPFPRYYRGYHVPWASTRKVKPIWIILKQETMSGSGISWAICKSAPRTRQITTPAPHHSVFLQAGCCSCRQANSVKALKALIPTVWRRRHIYIHSMAEKTSWHRWNEITSLSPCVLWDQQRNFCGVQRCKGAVAFIFSHSRLCWKPKYRCRCWWNGRLAVCIVLVADSLICCTVAPELRGQGGQSTPHC